MKKPFVALLLLVGAAAMVANIAFASPQENSDLGIKLVNAKMVQQMLSSRSSHTRTSAGPAHAPVWFGHSAPDHTGHARVNPAPHVT